jgi:hypothetical protein
MRTQRSATTCRWAVPTLFQPVPTWLDAWDRPWTCVRDNPARPLETTEVCHECSRWEAREQKSAAGALSLRTRLSGL